VRDIWTSNTLAVDGVIFTKKIDGVYTVKDRAGFTHDIKEAGHYKIKADFQKAGLYHTRDGIDIASTPIEPSDSPTIPHTGSKFQVIIRDDPPVRSTASEQEAKASSAAVFDHYFGDAKAHPFGQPRPRSHKNEVQYQTQTCVIGSDSEAGTVVIGTDTLKVTTRTRTIEAVNLTLGHGTLKKTEFGYIYKNDAGMQYPLAPGEFTFNDGRLHL
jgi:hypothetical protein